VVVAVVKRQSHPVLTVSQRRATLFFARVARSVCYLLTGLDWTVQGRRCDAAQRPSDRPLEMLMDW